MTFDDRDYSAIVFIDTMVALQCPPLPQLPWSEIDPAGPILVLVVPQVSAEIDKRKRDQRLAKPARGASKLLMTAATSDAPTRIADGPPQVDLALARTSKVDWTALDDLDPEEPDARVVAQVLHAKDVPPERRLLLSHDVNPLSMARRHGVKCKALPDSWLAPPEPHPKDQEIQRLKSEVHRLSATQPRLKVKLTFQAPDPLRLYRVEPLEGDEAVALVEALARANPPANQGRAAFVNPMGYDSRYDERYEAYVETALPRFVARLHGALEAAYAQVGFKLEVENVGAIQAERLVVALRASSGELRDRFLMTATHPPVAPEPRSMLDRISGAPWIPAPMIDFHRPGRHEMSVIGGDEGDGALSVQCEDFRHGQSWSFEGVARLDPGLQSPFSIEITPTAANLRGMDKTVSSLAFKIETVPAEKLIDVVERRRLVDIPLQNRLDKAISDGDFDWLEHPDDDEEEE